MANAGLISPVPSGSVNDLNKALLALAQFGLRETKAGHGADLELIHYDGVPLETTLIGRKKDVRFYGYLTKHKIAEIPANKANAPAAAYLPFQFLYHVSPLVILAVFIVQLGQLFTSEKREGTISFMNNLPTGKLKLLTARMATFLALTLPNFALACGVTYVITGVKFGWGTWSYPLVYSADGHTASIMTLGHYFTLVCGMLLAAVLFLMMLSALVSLLSGNLGVNVVLGGITLLMATSQALGQGPLRAVAKFIPSGYFDFTKVILHQTSWPIMSIGAGIAVMLIWALALYGVCAVILARREQL
jgi:ABC-type transport system involved in multi-copper enzyme maturation permease subunit